MKIFCIFLITFVIYSESVEIECNFEDYGDCDSCYGYVCDVQNAGEFISSEEDREITGVKGENDKDVKAFRAHNRAVKFFPRGVTKYFKNIEHVHIEKGELQKVSKQDLKEFGKNLKQLELGFNKIEIIESDLFEYNRNLRHIGLWNNQIKKIGEEAFNGLNLRSLKLSNNLCTGHYSHANFDGSNAEEVAAVIERVKGSCKA